LSPITTPGSIIAPPPEQPKACEIDFGREKNFGPIQTLSPIVIGRAYSNIYPRYQKRGKETRGTLPLEDNEEMDQEGG
jgi:hypothetical protein